MFRPFMWMMTFALLLAAGCGKPEGAKTPERLGEILVGAIEAKDMEAVRLLMTDTARANYSDPLEKSMTADLKQWLARTNAAYPPDRNKVIVFEGAEFLYVQERGREGIAIRFTVGKDGLYKVENILVSGPLYRRIRCSVEGIPDEGEHEEETVEPEPEDEADE